MFSRSTTRASSTNATDPSDPLFARLFLAQCALFLAPVLCDPCLLAWRPSTPDLVQLAWYSWCPVDSPGYDSGLTQEFAQRCFVVPCPTHKCGAAVVQAHAAIVGGAGVATECPIALCSVAPECSSSAPHTSAAAFAYQPRQLAWRPDGWTSTPRASSGAAVKSTPGSMVCFWYGCSTALCSVALWLFPATCMLVGSRVCLHAVASGSSKAIPWVLRPC